ncbi:Calcium-binding EF-hand [Penicillium expansum]|nr:Calcium-binding EF-hand [Penicillium expansum]
MASVTEAVKESLLGSTEGPHLAHQARANFVLHAQKDENGDLFMDEENFINAVAPKQEDYHKIKREQYGILFNVADRRRVGKLNITDWASFENLLAKPDAEYEIAFRLFDYDGTGSVKFDTSADSIPFDWNSEWASLYGGRSKSRHDMTYPQFAQMLRGLQGERIRQAFHIFDKDGDGFIQPEDFQRIILET